MSEFLPVCEKTVRAGGQILLEMFGKARVREKGQADLVTEADIASQDVARRAVLEAFPDHAFIGEEGPPESMLRRDTEYRWIIDPLDGTTNYVHGVPHFSVSLALERRGRLMVGAVYNPVADECFSAVAGRGAWMNGRPIRTSNVSGLSQSLAAVGFPAVVRDDSAELEMFNRAVKVCQAIRRTGSAALNLAYVAAGRFDVAWAFSTKVWDVAAGVLLIREAGGLVTDPSGGEFVLDRGHLLAAANARLMEELKAIAASPT